jgi:hypothetical protein
VVLPPPSGATLSARGATSDEGDLPALTAGLLRRIDVEGNAWFMTRVPPRTRLRVAAAFTHDRGDVDLALLRADGVTLASSVGTIDQEQASTVVRDETVILVHLYVSGGTTTSVALVSDVTPVTLADELEPNDIPAQATDLEPGSYRAVAEAEDWYHPVLAPGIRITATIDFKDAEGDLDLLLVDLEGAVVARSVGRGDQEQLSAVIPDGGALLRVSGGRGGAYTLRFSAEQAGPLDAFEDQDDAAETAPLLKPGRYPDLYCDRKEWFRVDCPPGKVLRATVTQPEEPEAADGDRRLPTIQAAGQTLSTADDQRTAVAGLRGGGPLFVQVVGGYGPYTLELAFASPEGPFEPNDLPMDAAPLGAGAWTGIATRGQDWYALTLAAGQTATIAASFVHADADVELTLQGPDGEQVASSTTSTDEESITWTAKAAGVHLLHVYTVSTVAARYDLRVSLGEGGVDLSQVHPNQRYRFGAGTRQLVMTVVRVGAGEVEYDEQPFELSGGAYRPAGTPERRVWRQAAVAASHDFASARRAHITVRSVTFDCAVVPDGGGETWIPLKDGKPTFPPLVRSTSGGVQLDLLRVD